MADQAGQADIRGIHINKVAAEYLDLVNVFKKDFRQLTTAAREVRWFQKTAGPLTMTAPATLNISEGSLPFVLQSSATRQTSYVKMWKVESPFISFEDLRDNDVNIWDMNLRDLTQAISYSIDLHCWNTMTEDQSVVNINSVTSAAAWDAASYTNVNIVEDLGEAKQGIYTNSGFSPEGATLYLSPKDHRSMINWLIDGKGSSIPAFASEKIVTGRVMEIMGLNVKISTNVTADYAAVAIPELACTFYSFQDIQTAFIDEPLVGRKLRIAAEGVATLDRPKCVALISNTQA